MSDVEISLPFTKFANQNKLNSANNNNNSGNNNIKPYCELDLRRSVSPRIVISKNLMSPESTARHSPHHNSTNSLSPSSVSPRTMSPSPEQRILINGYSSDGYPNYMNPLTSYQTAVGQPKKSFCIDALLSKNSRNGAGDHSPDANRFLHDDDAAHKYTDDQREYASSPEDGNSRWVQSFHWILN